VNPNGLAYDPKRKLVLVANLGDPAVAGSHTLSMIDLGKGTRTEVPLPGSTRWSVYHPGRDLFYVNISVPSQIVVVDPRQPDRIARSFTVDQAGAHGLDLDGERLFCACDSGVLVTLDASSGKVLAEGPLSGRPDVTWFNRQRKQLYIAVGDPGVIDVYSTETMQRLAVVPTERGAHTTAISPTGDWIAAFLPDTHRAAIYEIGGSGA
jgi:DNA-binding beta-propeller fold protein YncE